MLSRLSLSQLCAALLCMAAPMQVYAAGAAAAGKEMATAQPTGPLPLGDPGAGVPPQALPAPLSEADVAVELERLRAALAAEVPHSVQTARNDPDWAGLARAALARSDVTIDRPQLVVVVDRDHRVQAARILLARPDGRWEMVGGTHVSTGQTGRFDHYVTPLGVFPHTDAILDWRAEGTFNENHIRGLGVHGMRIWDFGWQTAAKGWLDNKSGPMRLLMHATDPANLALRIGSRASSGCVRIPEAMNIFLDRHGVLDFDYERAAHDDARYRALLRGDRVPSKLAGTLMIVIDSGTPTTGS